MPVTRRLVALLFITIMQQVPSPPAKFFQKKNKEKGPRIELLHCVEKQKRSCAGGRELYLHFLNLNFVFEFCGYTAGPRHLLMRALLMVVL